MRTIGIRDLELIDDYMATMDVDHDGNVSFVELLRWWSNESKIPDSPAVGFS